MRDDDGHHAACVDAWLARAPALAPDAQLARFEAALAALWRRTETTLGEVTLTAIAERVIYNAAEAFPFFAALTVVPTGIQCRERSAPAASARLRDGIRFVLVELLTVLGNLTADILTPELHAALASVAPAPRAAPIDPADTGGEDHTS